jgi:hypothetical protein
MSMIRRTRLAPFLALLVTGLPAWAQDLTIVSKVSGPMGMGGTSTQYFTSTKFRTNSGASDVIVDGTTGKIVMVDNAKKEYFETTFDEMNKMMQAASDTAAQAMKDLPPEARNNPMLAKMMEKMGGGGAPVDVKVEKGKNPRKIAGYDTEHWIVSMGAEMKNEIWTTSAIQPPPQLWNVQKAMFASNPTMQRFAKMADEMAKVKGFPLAQTTTWSMMGQSGTSSSEVTEVKKGPVAASVFEIPAGYKKGESPFAKMQQQRRK